MNKLSFASFASFLGLNDLRVTDMRGEVPGNLTLVLEDGSEIGIYRPKPERVPAPAAVPGPDNNLIRVAYFGYPDGGVGYNSSRRVIVNDKNTDSRYVCGYDTNDNLKYKKFLVRKALNLRFEDEPDTELVENGWIRVKDLLD